MDLLTELRSRRALRIVRSDAIPDPVGLAGATAVTVFPAARLGPAYVRDLLGPYPGTRLVMATESRFAEIRARAAEFVAAVTSQGRHP